MMPIHPRMWKALLYIWRCVVLSHWHLEKYSGEVQHILIILVFLKTFHNNIVRDRILGWKKLWCYSEWLNLIIVTAKGDYSFVHFCAWLSCFHDILLKLLYTHLLLSCKRSLIKWWLTAQKNSFHSKAYLCLFSFSHSSFSNVSTSFLQLKTALNTIMLK